VIRGRVAPGSCTPRPSRNRGVVSCGLSLSTHTARAIHEELLPFATIRRFLLLPVDQLDRDANDLPPFAPPTLLHFITITGHPAPELRVPTLTLVVLPLVASPFSIEVQVPTFRLINRLCSTRNELPACDAGISASGSCRQNSQKVSSTPFTWCRPGGKVLVGRTTGAPASAESLATRTSLSRELERCRKRFSTETLATIG
jgi:hypothetical protein